jgi:hypothetical protein
MIALSVVNFGMLSIWLNATVGILILIYHISFFAVMWATRKKNPTKIVAAEDDVGDSLNLADEPSIAIHMGNIASVIFLVIINLIAFSVMVDITTNGAVSSTLPAERIGSHKWNIKVEIGQTAVLGTELVMLSTILAICALGRKRYNIEQEDKIEEFEYGLA